MNKNQPTDPLPRLTPTGSDPPSGIRRRSDVSTARNAPDDFERLLNYVIAHPRWLAHRLCVEPHQAEDITQDVMKAYCEHEKAIAPSHRCAWFFAAAENCTTHLFLRAAVEMRCQLLLVAKMTQG